MLALGSATKFHVTATKTISFESLTIATTPHLLWTSLDASMFNLKVDMGGGLKLEGEDIEIVGSTSTWVFTSPL